jgi:putative transposase
MCTKVLALGKIIKTEKLSYKAFQKDFGRSVAVRAPGMFLDLLTRKAENAGGSSEHLNTRSTKLSQTCLCGKVEKKPLKVRHQVCSCGAKGQRDLFSAHLARQCTNQSLDIRQAKTAWPAAEPLLRRAMWRLSQTASRGLMPASFGLRRQRRSPVEDGSTHIEVVDAVADRREPQRDAGLAVRTPWL